MLFEELVKSCGVCDLNFAEHFHQILLQNKVNVLFDFSVSSSEIHVEVVLHSHLFQFLDVQLQRIFTRFLLAQLFLAAKVSFSLFCINFEQ